VQTADIVKVVNSFLRAATVTTVVGTFRRAGIALIYDEGRLLCRVSVSQARCVMRELQLQFPEIPEEEDDTDLAAEEYLEQTRGMSFSRPMKRIEIINQKDHSVHSVSSLNLTGSGNSGNQTGSLQWVTFNVRFTSSDSPSVSIHPNSIQN
jgi:hypothetical protein